jgi:hypothetical protein
MINIMRQSAKWHIIQLYTPAFLRRRFEAGRRWRVPFSCVGWRRYGPNSLTALAYNFIRMVNIVGVATLLKAV